MSRDTGIESGEQPHDEELARQLHDGPLQLVEFLAAGGYGQLDTVDDYRSIAESAAAELRACLDGGTAQPERLSSALHALASDTQSRAHVDVELHVDDDCDTAPEAATHCLLAATREALNNVVKHAGALHVDISCSRTRRNWIAIDIRDDGIGIEPEQMASGSGIRKSIFSRVIGHGGRVTIDSGVDGTGTVVHMETPCGGSPSRTRLPRTSTPKQETI